MKQEEVFQKALQGKKIPILTLDNKWHRLFTQTECSPEIKTLSDELNELLKRQGKITTETKEIKKIKSRLMNEIVELMDSLNGAEPGKDAKKQLEEKKRLINECNEKVDSYSDEMLELPKKIDAINLKLMLATMECCYHFISDNTKGINEISEWITKIRKELKKKVIRKQEGELKNHELYSYMHDIFGADVIELFDLKYDLSQKPVKKEN